MIFTIIVVIQLLVNLAAGYLLRPKPVRGFKIVASVAFPLVMLVIPIVGLFHSASQFKDPGNQVSVGVIGSFPSYWIIKIIALLVIQLLYNQSLVNRLQKLRG